MAQDDDLNIDDSTNRSDPDFTDDPTRDDLSSLNLEDDQDIDNM